MTTEPQILYNVTDDIATITLNRPEVHNAFNEIVIGDLTEMFRRAGDDPAVRAVVLRGAGKSFSAGGDLNWMRRMADYTYEQNLKDALRLGTLLKTINFLPKPTIALVHGNAFGGGVGLTACCDIAIAEETALFCLSEVRIGIIPSIIAPYVLTCIGESQARRYFLTAERFDGNVAARIGLVNEAVPAGMLDTACDKIIAALREGAPGAQVRGKKVIQAIAGRAIDDALIQYTSEQIAEARAGAEGREGLSAFLKKQGRAIMAAEIKTLKGGIFMSIDFKTYQAAARKTAFCPPEHKISYPAMGLAGEAGELANKVKKIMRGDTNRDELIEGIKAEMGDVLWYLSALADDLGADLGDIAQDNIDKLQSRYQRDTLRGAGDER